MTSVNYEKAIEELLALVRVDPADARSRLKLGDVYTRTGDIPNAIAMYEEVGKLYAQQGFALKAIAVYKQICSLIATRAPELRLRYTHIPPVLSDSFRRLGLERDAVAALDALVIDPAGDKRRWS
jgi:tetratricopeptide (TPR) repeat protein